LQEGLAPSDAILRFKRSTRAFLKAQNTRPRRHEHGAPLPFPTGRAMLILVAAIVQPETRMIHRTFTTAMLSKADFLLKCKTNGIEDEDSP
jgi:hypothetical protein